MRNKYGIVRLHPRLKCDDRVTARQEYGSLIRVVQDGVIMRHWCDSAISRRDVLVLVLITIIKDIDSAPP